MQMNQARAASQHIQHQTLGKDTSTILPGQAEPKAMQLMQPNHASQPAQALLTKQFASNTTWSCFTWAHCTCSRLDGLQNYVHCSLGNSSRQA